MDRKLKYHSGVTLWRQIQKILEQEILETPLEPGTRLPTEMSLSQRFGVNRHTVRRALQALDRKGLLRVEQGRGTFVREAVLNYALSKRVRFSENLGRQRLRPGGELLGAEVREASPEEARMLELKPLSRIIVMETSGQADGRCICLTTHCFPHARFQGIEEVYRKTGSVTAAYEHFGIHDYFRKQTLITARLPKGREAELLEQPRNRPVLVAEGVNVDQDGAVIEYGISLWAGDRVQLVVAP